MKKKIIVALVILICVAAVAFSFGRKKGDDVSENKTTIAETTKKNQKEEKTTVKPTEKETEKVTEIKEKDPDKIVSFEIPVLFLDTKYQNNLKALVRDKGYESATYTRNKQAVKIKLKNLSYDLYLAKTGISTISAICETFNSEEFPYVKNLGEYEDDFSYVTILVDSKKYMSAENKNDLFSHISNCCAYYLLQDNDSPDKYTVDICDEKTGNKLETRTFNKKDFLK